MKKTLFFSIFFLLSLLFFQGAQKAELPKVKYIKITPKNIGHSDKFYGTLKASSSSILNFQAEGNIVYLPYSNGDYVKKGTILAKIDAVLYDIRLKEESEKLKNAKIQLNRNESYYQRMDILHKQGAISDNDWEDAFYNLKTSAEQIDIQKEKVNYLKKQINFAAIKAPYDGYIIEKFAGIGENVASMQPIYRIIGDKNFFVETNVNYDLVQKLKLKDKVEVFLNNKMYYGEISHIAFSDINSGGYLVKISLNDVIKNAKDGASVDIYLNDKKKYILPIDTVFKIDDKNYIYKLFLKHDNLAILKKVEIIIDNNEGENIVVVLVDDELKEGEMVAICSEVTLKDGMKVEI